MLQGNGLDLISLGGERFRKELHAELRLGKREFKDSFNVRKDNQPVNSI